MKAQSLRIFLDKVEPWLVGFLLLYFLGLDFPPAVPDAVKGLIKASSYLITGLLIIRRIKPFLYALTQDIPLWLLHALAVFSVFWSAAPDVTSDETKALLRTALFGVYLAIRFSLKQEMWLVTRLLGIGAVLSLAAAIGMPSYGRHLSGEWVGAWRGVFAFKNLFAYAMTMSSVLFLLATLHFRRWRWLNGALFCLSAGLLVMSKGKTAYMIFLILTGLLPFYPIIKQRFRSKAFLLFTSILLGSVTVMLLLANIEYIVVDLLGKNLEFNGRMPIWNLIVQKISEHPWFGYGYSAFWTSDESYSVLMNSWGRDRYTAGIRFNAHNGYLDLTLQVGLVGLALYAISLFTVFRKAIYLLFKTKELEFFWVCLALIALSLFNLADSIGILGVAGSWTLYVSFSTAISLEYNRFRRGYYKTPAEENIPAPPEPDLIPSKPRIGMLGS